MYIDLNICIIYINIKVFIKLNKNILTNFGNKKKVNIKNC